MAKERLSRFILNDIPKGTLNAISKQAGLK
jgi:predicted RNA binding protein YcfA (HicA-like mRNA interferase family)